MMGDLVVPDMSRQAATAGRMAVDFTIDVGSLQSKSGRVHGLYENRTNKRTKGEKYSLIR